MKATIEIPDELYRRVKAKSALIGKPIREVTAELYRRWLGEPRNRREAEPADEWLRAWLTAADKAIRKAPPGASARQILKEQRQRPGLK